MNDNPRLPVLRSQSLPARRNARHPALWQEAAPVVARGAALVAAGLIGEWLLRSFARNAFNAPRNGNGKSRKNAAIVPRPKNEPSDSTVTISETVIMTRRVIVRR